MCDVHTNIAVVCNCKRLYQ